MRKKNEVKKNHTALELHSSQMECAAYIIVYVVIHRGKNTGAAVPAIEFNQIQNCHFDCNLHKESVAGINVK